MSKIVPVSEAEKQWFVKLHNEKNTPNDIEKQTGRSRKTVSDYLRSIGLVPNSNRVTVLKDDIVSLFEKGFSTPEAAKQLGVNKSTLLRHCKIYGLSNPNRKPTVRPAGITYSKVQKRKKGGKKKLQVFPPKITKPVPYRSFLSGVELVSVDYTDKACEGCACKVFKSSGACECRLKDEHQKCKHDWDAGKRLIYKARSCNEQ